MRLVSAIRRGVRHVIRDETTIHVHVHGGKLDTEAIARAIRREAARRGIREARPTRRSGSGRLVSEAEAREIEREIA